MLPLWLDASSTLTLLWFLMPNLIWTKNAQRALSFTIHNSFTNVTEKTEGAIYICMII